jgi:hypothetical protein
MPDIQDTLSTFAEISVALAGFSGIVIAFGRRSIGSLGKLEVRRLSNLFILSGLALVFSLLGISLLHLNLEDSNILGLWGSAAVLLLATPWLILLFPIRWALGSLEWQGALMLWTLIEALPLAVAGLSIVTSMTTRLETVRFRLSQQGPDTIQRVPVERFRGREPEPLLERPLRIVQLTDTHLGPWQSVARLRDRIAQQIGRAHV